jgi:outer membrane beta-barrel protein
MSPFPLRALVVLICGGLGTAQAQPVLEGAPVRNRLYRTQGKFELSPSLGFAVASQLVNQINLGLGAAYNFSDSWAAEFRTGFAFSGHTGTADQIAQSFLQLDPARRMRLTDDLRGLWELKANALLGIRWSPIYGKLSLFSELPLHFQGYLWLGGGAGRLHRQSIVYCRQLSSRDAGTCGEWLTDDATKPVASAAVGFRFFTSRSGSINLEVRDYLFRDSYLTSIDRVLAERGEPTGAPAGSPGAVNLFAFQLGYAFLF